MDAINDGVIEIGDLVQNTDGEIKGIVSSIVDYGTHVCYFIDCGMPIKFPAKKEWLKIIQKRFIKIDNGTEGN